MDKRLLSFVKRTLRKASLKWYSRNQAVKNALIRVEGRKHVVGCCYCKGEFYRKEVQLDHVERVDDMFDKNQTLDSFCERLFVGIEGWQVLCLPCHAAKTLIENQIKMDYEKKVLTKRQAQSKLKKDLKSLISKSKKQRNLDAKKSQPTTKNTTRTRKSRRSRCGNRNNNGKGT